MRLIAEGTHSSESKGLGFYKVRKGVKRKAQQTRTVYELEKDGKQMDEW